MNAANPVGTGAVYIPRQNEHQNKAIVPDKQSLVIEQTPGQGPEHPNVIKPANEADVLKANQHSQNAQSYKINAAESEQKIAEYRSLEMQDKKDDLSKLMGVDVYA